MILIVVAGIRFNDVLSLSAAYLHGIARLTSFLVTSCIFAALPSREVFLGDAWRRCQAQPYRRLNVIVNCAPLPLLMLPVPADSANDPFIFDAVDVD